VREGASVGRRQADADGVTAWFHWLAGQPAPSGDIATTLVVQRGVGGAEGLGLPCDLGSGEATEYRVMPASTLFFAGGHAGGVQPKPRGCVQPARARSHAYGRFKGDVCRFFAVSSGGALEHEAQGAADEEVDDGEMFAGDIAVVAVKFAHPPGGGMRVARQRRVQGVSALPVAVGPSGSGFRLMRPSGASLVLNESEVIALGALCARTPALKRRLENEEKRMEKKKEKKRGKK